MLKFKLITISALCAVATIATAANTTAIPAKSYTITDLKRIVTNSPNCSPIFDSLKQLASKQVDLTFKPTGRPGHFTMNDPTGTMQNSTFTILKEYLTPGSINRVGMGSFKLNQQQIDYVVQVGVDIKNPTTNYLYPVILSSNTRLCYYTALLKPTADTAMRFTKNIHDNKVKNGSDLTR